MTDTDRAELHNVIDKAIQRLPGSRLTLQTFLPALTVVVEHADSMTHLTGPQKRALVLSALDAAAKRLPPPEDTLAGLLVDRLGPPAIDAMVSVSRQAQTRLQHTKLFPVRRAGFIAPWRRFSPPRSCQVLGNRAAVRVL